MGGGGKAREQATRGGSWRMAAGMQRRGSGMTSKTAGATRIARRAARRMAKRQHAMARAGAHALRARTLLLHAMAHARSARR